MQLYRTSDQTGFPFTPPDFAAAAATPFPSEVWDAVDAPAARRQIWQAGRGRAAHRPVTLLPLVSFVWGGGETLPRPQTRGDHVLLWVTVGRLRVQLPARELRLMAGDLYYIPAGTAFATMPGPETRGHVAIIPRTLAEKASPALPAAPLTAELGEHEPQLITALRRLASATGPEPGPISLLASCLSGLAPRPSDLRGAEAAAPSRPDKSLIARFRATVLAQLGGDWTIADIARDLDCSAGALDQACLATQGCRAVDFVNRLRLEQAFEALRTTEENPARIAARLGYVSHAHLARACVAATGRTPEVFRAQSG